MPPVLTKTVQEGSPLFMLKSDSLMPHAVCWSADPALIWTMVFTNLVTFFSYLTIALTLLYLVRRTGRLIVRDWAYFVVGFALFILACGSTHLLEVITTWTPIFWVDAWTNIVTALLSGYVAMMLIRRVNDISFGINDYAERLAQTESEKLRMQESLVAAQKLEDWSRMSTVVSHEIKNPLQGIQNLQFLIGVSEGVSPQVAELARQAAEEAQRVVTIADTALSFIRQSKVPELIDLRDAADSVQFLLAPLIRQKSISFHIESRGDCKVEAMAGEVRQVLLNIARNACESVSRPGTHVTIDIMGGDSGVDVAVTDQGSGIDPNILPTLFQFGVTTKGDRGNGMGLWTVKYILNKHHGRVNMNSANGQGTRVDLWWPRAFAAEPKLERVTA
jgi:signal transduction histidine kinase